mmetsp:Transcript_10254/g.9923  ORF Transcript_10254/g.9923 Transcript_10254/m.9923 type:complete len:116 (+) Transcript_10254:1017-1364(+)
MLILVVILVYIWVKFMYQILLGCLSIGRWVFEKVSGTTLEPVSVSSPVVGVNQASKKVIEKAASAISETAKSVGAKEAVAGVAAGVAGRSKKTGESKGFFGGKGKKEAVDSEFDL